MSDFAQEITSSVAAVKGAGLRKYLWPFSVHQAFNGQILTAAAESC